MVTNTIREDIVRDLKFDASEVKWYMISEGYITVDSRDMASITTLGEEYLSQL